jgi:HPt (histidine-containing phosphotransfer) domain-containing protein
MIDWNRVTQLREEIGEPDFAEVVALFLEEVDEAVARLRDGFDPTTLAADFHFLKGSALNLGFRNFAALCQKGESAQRSNADTELVAKAIASYEKSRTEFLEQLATPLRQTG